MVNKPKNIGTAFESALVRYLQANGFPNAHRRALKGREDEGDVWPDVNPDVVFECKAGKAAETASWNQIEAWLKEAEREADVAGAECGGILVVKTKGVGAERMGDQRAFELWGAGLPAGPYMVMTPLRNLVTRL